MEFESFGVRDLDTLLFVDRQTHILIVVLERDERESKLLDVAGLGELLAQQVSELVVGLERANSAGVREHTRNIVVAVANADVLHDIARVQNIRAGRCKLNLELVGGGLKHPETHFISTFLCLGSIDVKAQKPVNICQLKLKSVVVELGSHLVAASIMFILDFNLLDGVLTVSGAVLTELAGEHSQADLGFDKVRARDLDEHVFGVECDLGGLAVDDGRQGEHLARAVVENRVFVEGLQNRRELLHFHVRLKNFEQFSRIHALLLLQRLENNVLGFAGLVCNWRIGGYLVKVVSTHGGEGAFTADVVVEFVLQVDERVVIFQVKIHVAKHASDNVRSYSLSLLLDNDFLKFLSVIFNGISRSLANAQVSAESLANSFKTKQIIAVCGNLNFVDDLLAYVHCIAIVIVAGHLHFLGCADLQLNTILEAQVFKLFVGEFAAHSLKEFTLQHVHVWHLGLLSESLFDYNTPI